jgi:hypothetical protein
VKKECIVGPRKWRNSRMGLSSSARFWDSPGKVIAGKKSHFGRLTLFYHLAMGLTPGRQLGGILTPMRH